MSNIIRNLSKNKMNNTVIVRVNITKTDNSSSIHSQYSSIIIIIMP